MHKANDKLNIRQVKKKQEWMTLEILGLMDTRRKHKNNDISKYKEIHTPIRKEIREAKEKYMTDRCNKIEALQPNYDTFNLHKKVKELTGLGKKRQCDLLKDKDGNIILDPKLKIKRWEEYLK